LRGDDKVGLRQEKSFTQSERGLETARSNGADHMVDYTREDFTRRCARAYSDIDLDLIAIQFGINGSRVDLAFVNRSRNEPSGKKMKQKHEKESPGESKDEPAHVSVRVKQGIDHEKPEGSGERGDADGDEHGP
jgi:hypothetical protein